MNLREFFNANSRSINYYPDAARHTGVEEAIFLQQICYWTGKEKGRKTEKDGWIHKSSDELEREIGFSVKVQRRVRKSLKSQGLIKYEYERETHKLWIKIIPKGFNKLEEKITQNQLESSRKVDGTLPQF